MLIRPSLRIFSSAGRRGAFVMRPGIDGDRQHARGGESQRLELEAVELGVAERQIDVPDERRQLLASELTPGGTAPESMGRKTPPA